MVRTSVPPFFVSFKTVVPAQAGIHTEFLMKVDLDSTQWVSVPQYGFPLPRERRVLATRPHPTRYNPGMPTSDLESTSLLTGLAPVIAADTRILILGSFPGARPLAAQQLLRASSYA